MMHCAVCDSLADFFIHRLNVALCVNCDIKVAETIGEHSMSATFTYDNEEEFDEL